jgi:hypothetical protein
MARLAHQDLLDERAPELLAALEELLLQCQRAGVLNLYTHGGEPLKGHPLGKALLAAQRSCRALRPMMPNQTKSGIGINLDNTVDIS